MVGRAAAGPRDSASSRCRSIAGVRGPGRSVISGRRGWGRGCDEPAAGDLADQRPRRDLRGDPGSQSDRSGGQRRQRLAPALWAAARGRRSHRGPPGRARPPPELAATRRGRGRGQHGSTAGTGRSTCTGACAPSAGTASSSPPYVDPAATAIDWSLRGSGSGTGPSRSRPRLSPGSRPGFAKWARSLTFEARGTPSSARVRMGGRGFRFLP
jgi:hypothetical protein